MTALHQGCKRSPGCAEWSESGGTVGKALADVKRLRY